MTQSAGASPHLPNQPSRRRRHWALVIGSALLPILLMAPLIYLQARQQAQGEAAVTANVVREQVDRIFRRIDNTIDTAELLLDQPCPDVAQHLLQLSALEPYFRALLLVENDALYCSSILGSLPSRPSIAVYPELPRLPAGSHLTAVTGTPMVRDRPAVLVTRSEGGGTGVLAIVDGQYLQDIQQAAAYNGRFDIQIVLRETQQVLASGRAGPAAAPGAQMTAPSTSAQNRFDVRISVAQSAIDDYRRQLWRTYAPFLLVAGLLAGYAAHLFNRQRQLVAGEIAKGIARGEFRMVYQPVLQLDTGALYGVEALLRWDHPLYGPIRPDLFIPVAEARGLIAPLTRHIFKLIARDLSTLGLTDEQHLGINIAGSHLAAAEFAADVHAFLALLPQKHPRLVFEVTERELLPDCPQVDENMTRLREQGVLWALDDFGTGHCSLAYLQRLQVDFIKIDRSFVAGIGKQSVSAVLLETIIGLGKALQIKTVAEGIETEEQRAFLLGHGVGWGQGYHYATPLSAQDLAAWEHTRRHA